MVSSLKYSSILVLVIALFFVRESIAQKNNNNIDLLLGKWEGHGELFGNAARFSMEWTYILGNQFLQLNFENSIESSNVPNGKLTALGIYKKQENNKYTGSWFDSRGIQHQLDATFDNGILNTVWSNASLQKGKTIYKLINKRTIEVKDYIWKGDQWSEFASAIYTKK